MSGVLVLTTVLLANAQVPAMKWEPQATGVTVRLRGISAVSARVAWASGANGTLLRTEDGGTNWALQFANTDPQVFLDAMAFRDADHGFAFSDSVDGQFVILATANGGAAWDRIPADRLPPALPDGRSWTPAPLTGTPAGFDTLGFAPGTSFGWASGAGGRISRIMP